MKSKIVTGILYAINIVKKDSEIKILIGCAESDIELAYNHVNGPSFFKALLVKNYNAIL